MIHRLKLACLMFTAHDTVVAALFKALDCGFTNGSFDEDHITSIFRVLIEVEALGPLEPRVKQSILQRITDERFLPKQQHCHSAYIGILGTLCDTSIKPFMKEQMFFEIIKTCKYWLPKHNTDSLVFEALWALNKLCRVAGWRILMKRADECSVLAREVKTDDWFVCCCDGWGGTHQDAVDAVREAEKLELLLQPYCQ